MSLLIVLQLELKKLELSDPHISEPDIVSIESTNFCCNSQYKVTQRYCWGHHLVGPNSLSLIQTQLLIRRWYRSIIRQQDTYSRLNITLKLFQKLSSIHGIFSPFQDFLRAFGHREDDDESIRGGFRSRVVKGEKQHRWSHHPSY